MRHRKKSLICLGTGLTLCLSASALTLNLGSYQRIVDRNVFGLKDPPVIQPPPDPKPLPPKLILTGITTITGVPKAWFKTSPPASAPGQPGASPAAPRADKTFALTINESDGEIQVLEIDVKHGKVKVNYAGSSLTLDLDKDSQNPSIGILPPSTPGSVTQPPATARHWPPEDTTMSHEEQTVLNLLQRQQNPNIPPLPGVPDIEALENAANASGPTETQPRPSQSRVRRF
jgi:hypothetical protein